MFLEGLKFALGLVAGWVLFSGLVFLTIVCVEIFARWREKHRPCLWRTKVQTMQSVLPQISERVVLRFSYHTDDWIPASDKSEFFQ
jgi:hypothetical protein